MPLQKQGKSPFNIKASNRKLKLMKSPHMKLPLTAQDQEFSFSLYPIDTHFNRIAGTYAFFIIPNYPHHPSSIIQQYSLLYLGITNNIQSRLRQHHKITQAIALGMTHIGIIRMSSGRKRKSTERKLLQNYNPPLNQTWIIENLSLSKGKL